MERLKTFFGELFFPPRCFVCGKEPDREADGCLCRFCRNRYEYEQRTLCQICHNRYEDCRCRPQFASPYIAEYARVTLYREERVSGRLVLSAKDCTNARLYRRLAHEMAEVVKKRGIIPEIVTFIPGSEESFRRKGFDHGEYLAKETAKQLGVPVTASLYRKKGRVQKLLSAEERLENSKRSLLPMKKAAAKVAGKRVLLIDDVMTTGASALLASIHLNEMGAARIDFVCFGGR